MQSSPRQSATKPWDWIICSMSWACCHSSSRQASQPQQAVEGRKLIDYTQQRANRGELLSQDDYRSSSNITWLKLRADDVSTCGLDPANSDSRGAASGGQDLSENDTLLSSRSNVVAQGCTLDDRHDATTEDAPDNKLEEDQQSDESPVNFFLKVPRGGSKTLQRRPRSNLREIFQRKPPSRRASVIQSILSNPSQK